MRLKSSLSPEQELRELPLSGRVLSMRVADAGLPVNFFID